MRPGIGTVVGDENRDVTEQPYIPIAGMSPNPVPGAIESVLGLLYVLQFTLVATAQRGWATAADVVNTWPLSDLLATIKGDDHG